MHVKHIPVLLSALVACGTAGAQAWDYDPSASLSGFGTLGVVQTNTNLGNFVSPGQHYGATRALSFEPDTILGIQGTARLNPVFSATIQVLTKEDGRNSYEPQAEWAFAKAQVLPELALRFGRMGAPFFAVSDFRYVGYSNLWVRPPLDVYGQVPISHFDGADAIYQWTRGFGTVSVQIFGGKANAIDDTTPVHISHQVGLNVTAELDNGVTLRIGRSNERLTVDLPSITSLGNTVTAYGYPVLGDQINPIDKRANFTGVGVSVDRGNWVANGEFTRRRTESFVPNTTGWAVTVGHRFGSFTPYVVASRLRYDGTAIVDTLPSYFAPLPQIVDGLTVAYDPSQKTHSAGLRWDVAPSVDIKTQFDRVQVGQSAALFSRVSAGLANSTVNVYSITLDFVF